MIIIAVDKHYLKVGVFKSIGYLKAAKATTDNDHALFVGFRNVEAHLRIVVMLPQNAMGFSFILEKYPARNAAKRKHEDGAEVEFCATNNC